MVEGCLLEIIVIKRPTLRKKRRVGLFGALLPFVLKDASAQRRASKSKKRCPNSCLFIL